MNTSRRKRGFALWIVAVLGTASLLAACSSPAPTPSGAPEAATCDAPAEVVIASFPVGVTLPTDVAESIGAFDEVEEKCNTKVTIASFDAPQPMVAGVLGGQVHFAVSNVQNQLLAAAQGQHLTGLLTMAQGGNGIIIGKGDGDATGIDAIEEYPENSIWAMTTLTGLSALVVKALIEAIGNDPAKAQLVQVGATGIASQVATGGADFGYVPSPTAAVAAIESGETRSILNASGPTVYELLGFIPGWTMLASPDFVAQYPVLAAEITAAELKGLLFIQDNLDDPAAVYDVMPDAYTSATPEDVWEKAWKWNVAAYTATGYITREDIIRTAELMQQYGVLTPDFDAESLPDTILAPEILEAAFASAGRDMPTEPVNVELLEEAGD
jgi:ABC-type nitrate/sulfonate/bicarbonate transport system substrate-binding protein